MIDHPYSKLIFLALVAAGTTSALAIETALADDKPSSTVLTGRDALGDWTTDAPGVRRQITINDLAKPFETPSANNFPKPARRPDGAMPRAPKGFRVSEYASGLRTRARSLPPPTATYSLPIACLAASRFCGIRTATVKPRKLKTLPQD